MALMTDHRWEQALQGPVWTVVVAAGSATRFGGTKLACMLAGRSVLDRSVANARSHADGVVLVRSEHTPVCTEDVDVCVEGGATRSESVRCGLAAVPQDAAIIVVHDAARPLAGPDLFAAVIAAVRRGADAAITAVPVVDTIKRVDGSTVVETLDRTTLVSVQTPQAFRADLLRRAHAEFGEATDDAALIERVGGVVVVAGGDVRNGKITTSADVGALDSLAAEIDAARR